MKCLIQRTSLLTALFSVSTLGLAAELSETVESTAPTTYCFPDTLVRGGYEKLVIDHNMIIPPVDHHKTGDIFVGARLKSQPEALWLLKSTTWQQILSTSDLRNSAHRHFEELPLVAPVTIFYSPTDVSELVGDVEIWVGYGLRSVTESAEDAFNEMLTSERYELLWQALPPPYGPASGVNAPYATLCLETKLVKKTLLTAQATD